VTTTNRMGQLVARWVMRFEAAGQVLRILLFGGTFLSTGVSALRAYGHGGWAWPFIAAVTVGTVLFAFIYERAGVWNHKNREKVDAGDNYSGPTMLMDARIEAAQLAALGAALQNGHDDFEDFYADLEAVTVNEWADMRDGIDIEDVEVAQ